jgi:thioredoxin-related protein
MKKVFSFMLRMLMRCYSTVAESSQRSVNAKIARQFHLWVAEKKYCRQDLSMSDVAEEFGVSTVPTLIVFDENGAEVKRFIGLSQTKQLSEFFSSYGKSE